MSKVLIAYAGKYGCTEECAKYIAEKMNEEVELRNLKVSQQVDPAPYDKVIIGGSVYAGRIQKEVRNFCLKNTEVLKEKKLGLYVCGIGEDESTKKELEAAYPQELFLSAIARDFFGGRIIMDKLGFLEKKIVKAVAKIDSDVNSISTERMDGFATRMSEV